MNLSILANVAEIVSAIAVVVTLVYLATQIRQAKEQIEIQGRQSRADAARDVLLSISDGEHVARLFAQLGDFAWGDYGLESKEDNARFAAWCHAWMRTEEHNFRALPPSERATQDQLLMMWMSTSWGSSFWGQVKAIYDHDFQVYVDGLKSRFEAAPRPANELLQER